MPIYEYHCPRCGADFEKLVSAQTSVACPTCASPEVTRTMSTFGLKVGTTFVPSTGGGCGCTPSTCGCH
ncbi:MAG: zinc ribbon domain-containing protein [Candidatus Rokubacteria bacterium]|nr:zinc ribbon domain-containing protein [Candidatus Rokubacteria bacterium]